MFTFHGSKETIVVYAWQCSREELRSAVRLLDKEQWQRYEREKIVQQLMEAEVAKVDAASFYGGLLRYGVSLVDADTIRATLDESGGVYFKEDTLDDEEQQETHAREVTALLLQGIERDVRLRHTLELLCQSWKTIAASASALRDFFLLHACLYLNSPDLAFVVPAVVCVQLERVRWVEVAARMLECALPTTLPPLEEVSKYARHEAVLVALLEESVWQAATSLGAWGRMGQLPTDTCEQVGTLSRACRDLAHRLSMQRTLAVYSAPQGREE